MYKNKKRRPSRYRGRKKAREFHELRIDGLLHGAEGVGRIGGRAVFVPRSVPGDVLKVRIEEKHKTFWRAEIVNIIEPSPARRKPPCHVFGRCGGCQWLHIDYSRQLEAKERNVFETIRRIGGLALDEVVLDEIVPSPRKYHYRMRTRLSARMVAPGTVAPGFLAARSHRVISHDDCRLYSPSIRKALFTAARRIGREWVDLRFSVHGAHSLGRTILSLDFDDPSPVTAFAAALESASRQMDLRWEILVDGAEAAACDESRTIEFLVPVSPRRTSGSGSAGGSTGSETLRPVHSAVSREDRSVQGGDSEASRQGAGTVRLRAGARSFFQANLEGNIALVSTVLEWAEPERKGRILDLYSGVGNFAVPLAAAGARVTAVEGDETAAGFLRTNSSDTTVEVIAGDAAGTLSEMLREGRKFRVCVLDPPREGARRLVDSLAESGVDKIVYVSCEASTLARDLADLQERGYRLSRLRPIDMFPQTYHVETVAELVKTGDRSTR